MSLDPKQVRRLHVEAIVIIDMLLNARPVDLDDSSRGYAKEVRNDLFEAAIRIEDDNPN